MLNSLSLNILISAYACKPKMGSEPGVGWNIVYELAKYHRVWVLTRSDNRPAIEQEMVYSFNSNLQFVYCDPPSLTATLEPAQLPHYYFWQIGAYFIARKLIKEIDIDLIHHVTYVRYSTPSFLSLLPVPFVWEPVGGGEMAPKAFWKDFSRRGKTYEFLRSLVHRLGELDPFTRITARRSILVKATTLDTARRLQYFGIKTLQVESESGLSAQEIEKLTSYLIPYSAPFRIISMARLLHWKGLHLSIQAFAAAKLPLDTEYWILGEGPEDLSLKSLAIELGLEGRVKFLGRLPRVETLQHLAQCHVLVHPSLHDSGGWVCLEAMAAGRPVVCLDIGGPSIQVTEEVGFKVPAHNPDQVIKALATAIERLAHSQELCNLMGSAGKQRVQEHYSWEIRGQELSQQYIQLCKVAPHAYPKHP